MKKTYIPPASLQRLIKIITAFVVLFSFQVNAQTTTVNSLSNLLRYLDDDNVNVKLAPGTYTVSANDIENGVFTNPILLFEGNNSTYDFTGVTINFETEIFRSFGRVDVREVRILGNNNVLKNLTMVDVGSVNDNPTFRAQAIVMDGQENRIEGFHVSIKGSFPYGYGDIFGKGGGSVIGHKKHSACLVRGNSNHVKNSTFISRSYGHGIFFQAANDPIIEGCHVEGELRTIAEVLAEEGTGSPADDADFRTVWGYNLKELDQNYRFSLQEDGIRAYNSGTTYINGEEIERGCTGGRVIDCTVVNMRSGVTIGWARGNKYVENCTTLACESGYWVGGDTEVVNSRGDASIGPLLSEDVRRSNSSIELTLLDNHVSKIGNTPSVYFAGSNHDVTIKDGTTRFDSGIEFLIGGERFGHRWLKGSGEEPPNFEAEDITFINQTNYPITLGANSENNDITSCGRVLDSGSRNDIRTSNDCTETGVVVTPPSTGDGNLVHITKRNATDYAIDGGLGGVNRQNVILSAANIADEGQLWLEIDRGNGFYSYEKFGTNYSLDGNGGGATNQSIYLWQTSATNQNQQWQKQAVGDGGFKIIKRNATGFAINGGSGGVEGRDINLFDSSNRSQNLQWYVTPVNAAEAIRLEAEDFDSMSGIQTENSTESGQNVGFINNGDWLRFEDVNLSGITNMDARVATRTAGGTIEVRIGSPTGNLIGSINVNNTGGYQNWRTLSTSISNASGTQDVYVVFTGGRGYLFNVNWIEFNTASTLSSKSIAGVVNAISNVIIYPNPVESITTIENAANTTITIYAMDSSVLFTQAISSDSETIDLSVLATGIYYAKVEGQTNVSVIKIVKQ